MTTKLASDVRLGDTLLVNMGRGELSRIVDRVQDGKTAGTVAITLYSSNGRRPVLVLPVSQMVKVVE